MEIAAGGHLDYREDGGPERDILAGPVEFEAVVEPVSGGESPMRSGTSDQIAQTRTAHVATSNDATRYTRDGWDLH